MAGKSVTRAGQAMVGELLGSEHPYRAEDRGYVVATVRAIEREMLILEQTRIEMSVRKLGLEGGWTRADDVPRFVERDAVLKIVRGER